MSINITARQLSVLRVLCQNNTVLLSDADNVRQEFFLKFIFFLIINLCLCLCFWLVKQHKRKFQYFSINVKMTLR